MDITLRRALGVGAKVSVLKRVYWTILRRRAGGGGGGQGEKAVSVFLLFFSLFFPSCPPPHRFLFRTRFSFRAPVSFTSWTTGRKRTPREKPQARQVIFLSDYKPNILGPSSGCLWISHAHRGKKNLRGHHPAPSNSILVRIRMNWTPVA